MRYENRNVLGTDWSNGILQLQCWRSNYPSTLETSTSICSALSDSRKRGLARYTSAKTGAKTLRCPLFLNAQPSIIAPQTFVSDRLAFRSSSRFPYDYYWYYYYYLKYYFITSRNHFGRSNNFTLLFIGAQLSQYNNFIACIKTPTET